MSAEIDQGVGVVTPAAGSVQVTPTADTTYTLTVTGSNDVQASAQLTVTVADRPAVSSFTATPATITVGQNSTLAWSASGDAIGAEIDQGVGTVSPAAGGSTTVTPSAVGAITYTLTVTDSNSVQATATVTLTVEAASALTFTADDASITAGQSATLRWTASNAKSAEIDQGVGAVSPASGGSVQVTPTADTTYTLTVTDNNNAQATAQLTVTVAAAPAVSSFTATPATITVGQNSTLAWSASGDAISAEIDQGVGAVSPAGGGSTTVTPGAAGSIVYTLTVTDSNGAQAAAAVTLTVEAASALTFTADDASITAGQSATLRWTASNAVSAEIDQGVGVVTPAAGGSVQVTPTADTTYTLTVTDNNNAQATAQLTVTVAAAPAVSSFTATPATITVGQNSTLAWSASGDAISAEIDQGVGTVSPAASGSTTVTPSAVGVIAYTLTVTDSNGVQATAQLTVTVVAAPEVTAFTVSPATITVGQQATLAWSASGDAISAEIDQGVGTVSPATSGSTTVTPGAAGSIVYTLTVTDSNGARAAASVTLTVEAASALTFTAADASITAGQSATLHWTASNAKSAEIDQGVGVVTPAGGGSVQVTPTADTTYTLTVTDNNDATSTARVTITVADRPTIAGFTATPPTLTVGQQVTLQWAAGGDAISAAIDNGVGAVSPAAGGSTTVTPGAAGSIVYTLTVTDSNAVSVQSNAAVTVREPLLGGRTIDTVAGNGTPGFAGDGDRATAAQLNAPAGLAVDGAGNLYIADTGNHRIRKVDAATGDMTTMAGTDAPGALNAPSDVAVGMAGNLYIADTGNHRIRKVDAATGDMTMMAGTDAPGSLNAPSDVAVDTAGNLYIADTGNHRIRKVDAATGDMTTVAGTGTPGYSGDGVAATAAQLNAPAGVALDGAGNLYIADTGNQRIRIVDAATGDIDTVAGTGTQGYSGDGVAATAAQLNAPAGVVVDGEDNYLYIADTGNQRIRIVDANGDIDTVAGTGTQGYSGDGVAAIAAQLNAPAGVALDGAGNLYIADASNQRIRKVGDAPLGTESPGGLEPPGCPAVVQAQPGQLSFALPQDAEPAAQTVVLRAADGEADFHIQPAQGWITAMPQSGSLAADGEAAVEVTVDPAGLEEGTRSGRLHIRSGGCVAARVRIMLEVLPPLGPAVSEHGVVNAAAMSAFGERTSPFVRRTLPPAPGSMVALLGKNFAAGGLIAAEGFPLPLRLGGVSVRFDGLEARLFAVTSQRIYAQLPSALAADVLLEGATSAIASVVVETAAGSSYPRRFFVGPHGPGIFTISGEGTGQGAVLLAGTTVLAAPPGFSGDIQLAQPGEMANLYTASRPARAGEIVEIYATGLGAVEPPIADGANSCEPQSVCAEDFSNAALRRTVERPRVWIGGVEIAEEDVLFSGLAPTLAAMNLVAARAPQGVEASDAVEVKIAVGGRESQPGVTIAVE